MIPQPPRPVVALAVTVTALPFALVLDHRQPEARDVAILVSSLAVYVMIPATALLLIVAGVQIHGSRHDGERR